MKILFVCTGNICRSPLAEGILKKKLKVLGIKASVDSCGFERFHVGDEPDRRAQTVAKEHGIDISGHRARLFQIADFDQSDRIYVMDSGHFHDVMRLARSEEDKHKVDYTMNILYPGKNIPVPDPWYDSIDSFYAVYNQLDKACSAIAERIKKE